MDSVTVAQIISIFGIFLLTVLCVFLPLKIAHRKTASGSAAASRNALILSICNCFSAGVFLGTCFLMLIPFIENKFTEVLASYSLGSDWVVWVSQLSIMAGLFLSIFLEQAVETYRERRGTQTSTGAVVKTQTEFSSEYTDIPLTSQTDSEGSDDVLVEWERKRMIKRKKKRSEHYRREGSNDGLQPSAPSHNGQSGQSVNVNIDKCDHMQMKDIAKTDESEKQAHQGQIGHSHCDTTSSHGHSHMVDLVQEQFGVRCLLLFLALSVHSVFEGVAVGIQDELYKLLSLLIGVVVHEVLMAFAMGVSLARQSITTSTFVKLALVYSATIPVGVAVGMGLKGIKNTAGGIVSAVTQGITAGTFLYVIFIEVLPVEINKPRLRLVKVAVMFLGMILIGALQFLPHDDQGH